MSPSGSVSFVRDSVSLTRASLLWLTVRPRYASWMEMGVLDDVPKALGFPRIKFENRQQRQQRSL
ncbi:hypothetical protein E4U42_002229 [Claviceps africana]|uniref:Uncharacterized protein n=1 Tax=Claviceps africana TaxID=83212 RepID=A0A8K0NPH7_9HYPO|nr:hypothetical protein E4U42_002229 [Claviceps africana]